MTPDPSATDRDAPACTAPLPATPQGLQPYYEDDFATIYHGDCRLWPVSTVATVITDPPYARAALDCWSALAEIAGRSLAPAGWLVAYSGQACLPDVYGALDCNRLAYRWTLSARYEGGGQVVSVGEMAVLSEWKPILLYRKRPFGSQRGEGGRFIAGDRDCIRDLLRRGGRQKQHHPWAQPEGEASQLVSMFSRPGDTILDPFMGSGTTLVAAKAHGRRCIGIEVDEAHCETAAKRLAQEVFDFGGAA